MESVFLVRHAESEYSAKGLVNGDPSISVGLTKEGRRQARALGETLVGEEVDLTVVTEFSRTRETAELALAGRSVLFLVVPELNDPDYGDFEGASLDEYRAWLAGHGSSVRIPGSSESRLDLVRRYGTNWARPLAYSRAGRELIRLGFGEDLRDAARFDAYPVLPHFHERRVTLLSVPV